MEASEDSSTEIVSDMLQKLSIANEAERKELLSEARPYLLAPDAPVKFKRHLESYNFSVLFDCVDSSDKLVVTTTCEILTRVFQFVDPILVVEKYGEALEKCLIHSNPQVKEVCLVFLNRFLSSQECNEATLLSHQK